MYFLITTSTTTTSLPILKNREASGAVNHTCIENVGDTDRIEEPCVTLVYY